LAESFREILVENKKGALFSIVKLPLSFTHPIKIKASHPESTPIKAFNKNPLKYLHHHSKKKSLD
jgi:hypothetical protein